MIYKLTGITLPIAEIHCDKRQQMLNSKNQPLKTGQKKKKKARKIHLQRHPRTQDICTSTSAEPLNSMKMIPSI